MTDKNNDINVTIVTAKLINAEYIAKVLINEAHMSGLTAYCGKTRHILANYRKSVKITDK